ncbi:MAG: glycerol-3-phosphate dehydrogenase/oxidase [Phototrophicaceae bacterium]
MWSENWRDAVWSQLDEPWDVVVIGGGITGAGLLRESARLGLRALLVEQHDFAWGTSSRSSKLVHGGLRYLATGQLKLTWHSVREREHLLEDGPGLIDPLGFLMATHEGDHPGRWTYKAGLSLYDLMALQWTHRYYTADEFQMLAPGMTSDGLEGGFRYGDAQTDDARLVLRVILEAVDDGGAALNYARAAALIRDEGGEVTGVRVEDRLSERSAEVRARLVVNATGTWADHLRGQVEGAARIRPLRGSHLILPGWRLPLAQAVAFLHPLDRRPVFVYPWEGVVLVGTTDIDHNADLDAEPGISPEEVAYLMAALAHQFPAQHITLDDVLATYAGVRPVIGTGKDDPSKESREHAVWEENGLLTITGGKLTTFRLIALDALRLMRHRLPDMPEPHDKHPVLNPVEAELPDVPGLDDERRRRLLGRYGAAAPALVAAAAPGELAYVPGTQTTWAEIRWAARAEGVAHLEDIMLRRTRLGLLLPGGGVGYLPRVRHICQPELGWDDARWQAEADAYLDLWQRAYGLPERARIPDWHAMLQSARERRQQAASDDGGASGWWALVGVLLALAALLLRRRRARG